MLCKKALLYSKVFYRQSIFQPHSGQCQQFFSFFQSLIKLYVEILILVIWFEIESVHHKEVQISDQIRILSIVQYFLYIQQKIMPVIDKFLIIFQIRCVDPFFYFDLTSVCFGTFMDLKNIFKSPVFIKSSQRKQPAEAAPQAS